MSYPTYNPYDPGHQNVSQGQYGPPAGQTEGDLWNTMPYLGPGSSLSSHGGSSGDPARLGSRVMGQLSGGPVINSQTSQTSSEISLQSSFNISARKKVTYPTIGQGALTSMQRDIVSLPTTSESRYSVSSASQGLQHSSVGHSSFNWFPDYRNYNEDNYAEYSLNPCDYTAPPTGLPLPRELVCTPQLAEKILIQYGIQKEDLTELINCPDEAVTPENLPYTLQKMRMKKANRALPALTSYSASQAGASVDKQTRIFDAEMSSISCHTLEVAQYRHTGICSQSVEEKTFDTLLSKTQICGNPLLMDNVKTSSQNKEVPEILELTNSGSICSDDQVGSISILNSTRNVVVPAQQVQTPPNPNLQSVIPVLTLGNKNMDIATPKYNLFGIPPAKAPVDPFTSKTQSPSNTSQGVGVHTESYAATWGTAQNQDSKLTPQKRVQKRSQFLITRALQSAEPTALKPVPSPSYIPTIAEVSRPTLDPGLSVASPSDPTLDLVKTGNVQEPKRQSPITPAVFKGLPSLTQMHDYTATKPRRFSHTCSLCKTECFQIKVSR